MVLLSTILSRIKTISTSIRYLGIFNGVKVPTESMATLSSGKEIVHIFSHFKSKVIRQEAEVHERVRYCAYACITILLLLTSHMHVWVAIDASVCSSNSVYLAL